MKPKAHTTTPHWIMVFQSLYFLENRAKQYENDPKLKAKLFPSLVKIITCGITTI